jgi:hypothetical protein
MSASVTRLTRKEIFGMRLSQWLGAFVVLAGLLVAPGALAQQGNPCSTSADCAVSGGGNLDCVDYVCCNSACSGQCQACNVAGSIGTCVTITGPPVGTRAACTPTDPNNVCSAKECSGKNPNACDVFVGSDTVCAAAVCTDGIGSPQAVCLGDGGCQAVVAASCGAFACVSGACATSCTDDAECSPGSYCNVTTGACVAPDASTGSGAAGGATKGKTSSSGCAIAQRPAGSGAPGALFVLGVLVLGRRRTRRELLQGASALALGSVAPIVFGCRSRALPAGAVDAAVQAPLVTARSLAPDAFATLTALCDRLLPRDEDPGALDLGVPAYIDQALASPELASVLSLLVHQLPNLDREARRRFGAAFHDASAAQKDSLIASWQRDHEQTRKVFDVVLDLTLEGAFGDPKYGGNSGGRGFAMIGFAPGPPLTAMHGMDHASHGR